MSMTPNTERSACIAIAAVLWTTSLSLAVIGTFMPNTVVMVWSGLAALVGCIISNHLVVQHAIRSERIRVEHLIDGLIASAKDRVHADARADVHPFR